MDSGGYKQRSFNQNEKLPNYTHGLAIILLVLEYVHILLPLLVVVPAGAITVYIEGTPLMFVSLASGIAASAVLLFAVGMVVSSRMEDPAHLTSNKKWEDFIVCKDKKLAEDYKGVKMPMEVVVEAYMNQFVLFLFCL